MHAPRDTARPYYGGVEGRRRARAHNQGDTTRELSSARAASPFLHFYELNSSPLTQLNPHRPVMGATKTFIDVVLIPAVSLIGMTGNALALSVLSRGEDVHQMKKSFANLLLALTVADSVLLLTMPLLFSVQ